MPQYHVGVVETTTTSTVFTSLTAQDGHKAQFKTLLFEHVKHVASIQSEWNELCLCVNIMLLQERNSLLERNLMFK